MKEGLTSFTSSSISFRKKSFTSTKHLVVTAAGRVDLFTGIAQFFRKQQFNL
jgi:hypothetical protein